MGVGNTGAFVPLHNLTADYQTIASTLSAQDVSTYADPSTPPTVLLGYAAQKQILVNRYQNTDSAVMEFPFSASTGPVFAFLKPSSRGTIKIASTDPFAEPSVDFRTLSNPVDLKVMIRILQYVRQYFSTPTMAQLGPVELLPGAGVSTEDAITAMFRSLLVQPSFFHPCCTAAMMPRAKGGVVGTDLLVYGVKKLSVVDASIMPLIPGTHLCETVYAVAEKVRFPAVFFIKAPIRISTGGASTQNLERRRGLPCLGFDVLAESRVVPFSIEHCSYLRNKVCLPTCRPRILSRHAHKSAYEHEAECGLRTCSRELAYF